jgi:signal transduction histidine kinase
MAEGDVAGVRQEAKEVDWSVNSQVYLPSRVLNALIQSWRWVALILSMATFLLVLGWLHRQRLQQVERQFNMRLEERLNERTRIARDLHDTLLQSFQGLLLRFDVATNLLPERPDEARKRLKSAIDQAEVAIIEGRDAVQGLRSSTVLTNDLVLAISALGEELATGESNPNQAVFHVAVEGTSRDLHPISRDEIFRIAGEAMRNAFKHAQAQRIEVEIQYLDRHFRLSVRDDGKGMDCKFVNEGGRVGHYGLRGMHERAKLLGGELTVRSQLDSGTEVKLSLPAANTYATPDSNNHS